MPRSVRSTRALRLSVALLATLMALALPRAASAFERQWHVGANIGYAVETAAGSGFGGGLHLTYGLTDAFNAMVELDLTAHPSTALVLVPSASAGVGYVIDILEWVPYVGLMAGAYDLWSQAPECGAPDASGVTVSCHAARIGASVPFGLDYQLSRSFAVGIAGRYHMLFGGDAPESYLTLFARAELIWGF